MNTTKAAPPAKAPPKQLRRAGPNSTKPQGGGFVDQAQGIARRLTRPWLSKYDDAMPGSMRAYFSGELFETVKVRAPDGRYATVERPRAFPTMQRWCAMNGIGMSTLRGWVKAKNPDGSSTYPALASAYLGARDHMAALLIEGLMARVFPERGAALLLQHLTDIRFKKPVRDALEEKSAPINQAELDALYAKAKEQAEADRLRLTGPRRAAIERMKAEYNGKADDIAHVETLAPIAPGSATADKPLKDA